MTLAEKQQHDKEISDLYLLRDEDITAEEYETLSIQDLCVLINNGKWLLNSEDFGSDTDKTDGMKNRIREMHKELIQKLRQAPVLYSVVDVASGFPFITEIEDSIWIFSEREYAEACVEHYREESRNFRVHVIKKERFAPFLSRAFFTNGVGGIFLDNGQVGHFIRKEYLLNAPDYSGMDKKDIPVVNPDFMRVYLKFLQELGWKAKYYERKKVLEKLEYDLIRSIRGVRFLVPTKGAPESLKAQDIRLGENGNVDIPMLFGENGKKGLPVFTDWDQFNLMYGGDDYHAWALDFDSVVNILYNEGGFDSIVLNYKSRPLNINQELLGRIQSIEWELEERKMWEED